MKQNLRDLCKAAGLSVSDAPPVKTKRRSVLTWKCVCGWQGNKEKLAYNRNTDSRDSCPECLRINHFTITCARADGADRSER